MFILIRIELPILKTKNIINEAVRKNNTFCPDRYTIIDKESGNIYNEVSVFKLFFAEYMTLKEGYSYDQNL